MSAIKRIAAILAVLLLLILLGGCARKQEPAAASGVPGAPGATPAAGAMPAATLTSAAEDAEGALLPGSSTTGLPNLGAMPAPTAPPQVYFVQAGDTIYAIARRFGLDPEQLVQINQIDNPSLLQVGQQLKIPSTSIDASPDLQLLPNSEFVYSPAYVNFDTAAFVARQGGYLDAYTENVGGQILGGAEIVDRVAHHYSVGPRLLLAVIEHESGWVTNPRPSAGALAAPVGNRGGGWGSLHVQLAGAADRLNEGYYDWRGRGMSIITWADGTATHYAPTLNAATAGLQYFYSLSSHRNEWETLVGAGPGSFLETYRRLFGDPAQYAIEPLIPANTTNPTLALPWSRGELWYYTGGPHGGWNEGSAWSAIDVVPDEGYLGCRVASAWATAAAPGLVIYSQDGEVLIDLDGDGREETGWVLFYLHLAAQDRVPLGMEVKAGDPIGHASCEGGFSESTHLHLARRYNGEWIAVDGPLPLILSGWQFHSSGVSYDGTATRGGQERTACECRNAALNGLVAD